MAEPLRIAYVMPNLLCCGGHRVILEHAIRLSKRGHDVRLVPLDSQSHRLDWYPVPEGSVRLADFDKPEQWLEDLDCVVATFNETVWKVLELPGGIAKFYFLQSDERPF